MGAYPAQARKRRDFDTADRLRAELVAIGVQVTPASPPRAPAGHRGLSSSTKASGTAGSRCRRLYAFKYAQSSLLTGAAARYHARYMFSGQRSAHNLPTPSFPVLYTSLEVLWQLGSEVHVLGQMNSASIPILHIFELESNF